VNATTRKMFSQPLLIEIASTLEVVYESVTRHQVFPEGINALSLKALLRIYETILSVCKINTQTHELESHKIKGGEYSVISTTLLSDLQEIFEETEESPTLDSAEASKISPSISSPELSMDEEKHTIDTIDSMTEQVIASAKDNQPKPVTNVQVEKSFDSAFFHAEVAAHKNLALQQLQESVEMQLLPDLYTTTSSLLNHLKLMQQSFGDDEDLQIWLKTIEQAEASLQTFFAAGSAPERSTIALKIKLGSIAGTVDTIAKQCAELEQKKQRLRQVEVQEQTLFTIERLQSELAEQMRLFTEQQAALNQ
jgi:hypothetical protein